MLAGPATGGYAFSSAISTGFDITSCPLEIPDTENVYVHEDLADAAMAMPAELAVKFALKAHAWVNSPYLSQSSLPEKLGALVSHLAKGGKSVEALELACALLAVLPDPHAPERDNMGGIYLPLHPRPRFHTWWYGQILMNHVPDLLVVAGEDTLEMLCHLLEDTVRLAHGAERGDGPSDHSHIWRPAVEAQSEPSLELNDLLVSAVRDAAEILIETKGKAVLA